MGVIKSFRRLRVWATILVLIAVGGGTGCSTTVPPDRREAVCKLLTRFGPYNCRLNAGGYWVLPESLHSVGFADEDVGPMVLTVAGKAMAAVVVAEAYTWRGTTETIEHPFFGGAVSLSVGPLLESARAALDDAPTASEKFELGVRWAHANAELVYEHLRANNSRAYFAASGCWTRDLQLDDEQFASIDCTPGSGYVDAFVQPGDDSVWLLRVIEKVIIRASTRSPAPGIFSDPVTEVYIHADNQPTIRIDVAETASCLTRASREECLGPAMSPVLGRLWRARSYCTARRLFPANGKLIPALFDPDSQRGKTVHGYAKVLQSLDDGYLLSVEHVILKITTGKNPRNRTNFVDDAIVAYVAEVEGTYTYETRGGVYKTVPQFSAYWIQMIPPVPDC